MPKHEQSVVIARPIDDVFSYMNDVSREHEWQPQLLEAEQIPPGPTAVGSKRRYVSEFMGKRLENTYSVIELEPGRRIVCETDPGSAVSARTVIQWDPSSDGTRVTMSIEGKAGGLLRFVPPKLIEATFRSEVQAALGRLKERLEGGV